ncbi:MAG: hypothetical protein WCP60_10565 [bacterium]
MSPELEAKLVSSYPEFFASRAKGVSVSDGSKMPKNDGIPKELGMSDVCWCDDGWYGIINDFCYLTKETLDHARYVLSKDGTLSALEGPKLEFVQIKEKLGTLRLYYKLWQPDFPDEDKDPQDLENRLMEITHEISGYNAFAYLLSSKTCELSGSAGKLRISGGCLKTLSQEKAMELGFQDLPRDHYLNG